MDPHLCKGFSWAILILTAESYRCFLCFQADAKRLPPAIFNCTTNAAEAAAHAAPPTEVSQGEQDAPSLLDAGAVSAQGSQSGMQQLSNADIGSRTQEFSFASKVSNSVSSGSADLSAP